MAVTKVTLTLDEKDSQGNALSHASALLIPTQRFTSTDDEGVIGQVPIEISFDGTVQTVDVYPNDLIGPQGDDAPGWGYTRHFTSYPGNTKYWPADKTVTILSTDGNAQNWSDLESAGVPDQLFAIAAAKVTLVAGTVSVANTNITANSIIRLNRQAAGGTLGQLSVALTAGTGFAINSSNAADTSSVYYEVVKY